MKSNYQRLLHLIAWSLALGAGPLFTAYAHEPAAAEKPATPAAETGEAAAACGCEDEEDAPAVAATATPAAAATPATGSPRVVVTAPGSTKSKVSVSVSTRTTEKDGKTSKSVEDSTQVRYENGVLVKSTQTHTER